MEPNQVTPLSKAKDRIPGQRTTREDEEQICWSNCERTKGQAHELRTPAIDGARACRREVTITQSDSDSEESAQFAGIQRQYKPVVSDYRILSAEHNVHVLGEKCLRPFIRNPQHASAGNETEYSGFNSRHIKGPMRTPDSFRSSSTNSSL